MTKQNDLVVVGGTQIFTDEETRDLQNVTGITDITDSVTLISALLSRIAANPNNVKAIELYQSIMYVPRYPAKDSKN